MSKVEKHIKRGALLIDDVKGVLNAYKNIIKWKDGCKVLDFGCGTGIITKNLLLPSLPESTQLVVGVDRRSKLIYNANKHNPPGSILTFRVGDILDHPDIRDFDYVVSFDYLHQVSDHKSVLANVKKVLKHHGEVFFHFSAATNLFNICNLMSQDEKWRMYLKNFQTRSSPYENSIDIKKDIEILFKHLGFQVYTCSVHEKLHKLPLFEAIPVAISRCGLAIPKHLIDDFAKDFLNYMIKFNYNEVDEHNMEYMIFSCQIAVVYGKKTAQDE
ncbi:hypothetical protein PPYR_07655 [Photinus pyralis]|uniref:Methyltransferase domain-containing protein n=1 Tax=Photinus pyralis TaxID=7054 RepID=A0A1Y1JY82_PHOPY|nr:hypothetical protein PPYR_07655 [Photinus pyralis]